MGDLCYMLYMKCKCTTINFTFLAGTSLSKIPQMDPHSLIVWILHEIKWHSLTWSPDFKGFLVCKFTRSNSISPVKFSICVKYRFLFDMKCFNKYHDKTG
jgi:hypothetical protein